MRAVWKREIAVTTGSASCVWHVAKSRSVILRPLHPFLRALLRLSACFLGRVLCCTRAGSHRSDVRGLCVGDREQIQKLQAENEELRSELDS